MRCPTGFFEHFVHAQCATVPQGGFCWRSASRLRSAVRTIVAFLGIRNVFGSSQVEAASSGLRCPCDLEGLPSPKHPVLRAAGADKNEGGGGSPSLPRKMSVLKAASAGKNEKCQSGRRGARMPQGRGRKGGGRRSGLKISHFFCFSLSRSMFTLFFSLGRSSR